MNTGQIFDLILVIFFLIGIIRGWMIGLAVKVGHVIAMIASCLTAHICGTLFQDVVGAIFVQPFLKGHENGIFAVQIVKNGLKAFSSSLAYDLIFLIVFIIAILVFSFVVQLLKIVDRIPVVGTLNKCGGALLGLVTEFIIIYIICTVLFSLVPQSTFDKIGLTKDIIRETKLLQFFVGN